VTKNGNTAIKRHMTAEWQNILSVGDDISRTSRTKTFCRIHL